MQTKHITITGSPAGLGALAQVIRETRTEQGMRTDLRIAPGALTLHVQALEAARGAW